MNETARRTNARKLLILAALVLLAAAAYLLVEVRFGNDRLVQYALRIRAPKLIAMLVTAFAIGGASIVFQSIINNRIVTPCLLGMNSLYTLIHTAVVFVAGSGSILAVNANLSFAVDLLLMGLTATLIYSYLFQKTKHPMSTTPCSPPWWPASATSTPRSSPSPCFSWPRASLPCAGNWPCWTC